MNISRKKLAITILTILTLSLALSLILSSTASAYQIPDYFRPSNAPFGLTGDTIKTGEQASSRVISILQILAGGLLYFAAPVAIIMITISSISMIVSGDNPDKVTESKNGLIWAVVGLLIIILSFSIVRIVLGILIKAAESTVL